MEIIFKNSGSTSKGKQCQEFLSILKKLKFILPTKDKSLSFFIEKKTKKFMISTFSARNLQNPPSQSPLFYIDYQFGEDMYNLTDPTLSTYIFCFDIQDVVKTITHYYETKMSVLKLSINNDMTEGSVFFQIPSDQTEGTIQLNVQRINQFPQEKTYLKKDYVDYVPIFELNELNFEQFKQVQDTKYSCCYEIHEEGIFLKNYMNGLQGNKFLLNKQSLIKYDSVAIKSKLRGFNYIMEPQNYLIDEIKIAAKKNYKKLQANLIIVRHPQNKEMIRNTYIQIQAQLVAFPKTTKRIICLCHISENVNSAGFMTNQASEDIAQNHLLKNEEPTMEGLRKIILNKWANPRKRQYMQEQIDEWRQRLGANEIREEMLEETKTRKIFYKIQED